MKPQILIKVDTTLCTLKRQQNIKSIDYYLYEFIIFSALKI